MELNFQNYEYYNHAITVGGKLVEIPLRKGEKDSAFIDAITFTINKRTIDVMQGLCVTDAEYVAAYSELLIDIFGFGVTEKLGKGRYFYNAFYRLGSKNADYGTLHICGQRDTILVELTGTACQAAKAGWEKRLYDFLKRAIRAQLTRTDVARDFFNGEYTPEMAMLDHDKGLFTNNNRKPKSECIGTAWRHEDGSGKTFAVGKRGNAKYYRNYEKGRQLGDTESAWVRSEVEFRKQKNFIIPLEILLYPGEYFAGAYSALEKLTPATANRIETNTQKVNIVFDSKLQHGKNQVGRLVRLLSDMGWQPEKIVQALIADEGKYPKGLSPEEYDCDTIEEPYFTRADLEAIETGEFEPDEVTQIVQLENAVMNFDEQTPIKEAWQQQLINEFPEDLKRYMEAWKERHRFYLSEASLHEHHQARIQTENSLEEYLDYMYVKYGTLFPNSKTQKQRNPSWH